jgi:general stress protein YciG
MGGKQGFASMSPEKRRAIARLGGIAAHKSGGGHEWTKQEARDAAKIGVANRRHRAAVRDGLVDEDEDAPPTPVK